MIDLQVTLSVVTVAALLVLAGLVHRDLVQLGRHLEDIGRDNSWSRHHIDRMCADVANRSEARARAVEGRLETLAADVVTLKQVQSQLAGHVNWMAPWVHQWASSGAEEQR